MNDDFADGYRKAEEDIFNGADWLAHSWLARGLFSATEHTLTLNFLRELEKQILQSEPE